MTKWRLLFFFDSLKMNNFLVLRLDVLYLVTTATPSKKQFAISGSSSLIIWPQNQKSQFWWLPNEKQVFTNDKQEICNEIAFCHINKRNTENSSEDIQQ